ncbi:tetratricopeptide repeat protein [Bradyrhizobium canariense]|uniref:tetratricopeptide repeat protein n=1 Tax=Bradyrhizobium canariense TaxID=255045 RepID=UPI001FD97D9F|nr:tetratricopeptide repeat protein [Bradyrhizobium canariense]
MSAKCNAAGNFSVDDRIAGCTAMIEAATGMQPAVIMAHFRRAMFYRQKGEIDFAIADYNQIIERDPGNLNARIARASAFIQKRQPEAALSDYAKAIELDPKSTYAYIGRAHVYSARRDFVRAIADYDQALVIHPDNVIAYVERGLAYIRKGDPDRAMATVIERSRSAPKPAAANCAGVGFTSPRAIENVHWPNSIKPRRSGQRRRISTTSEPSPSLSWANSTALSPTTTGSSS